MQNAQKFFILERRIFCRADTGRGETKKILEKQQKSESDPRFSRFI